MDLGFGGEIADLYHRFRRRYPAELVEAVAEALSLRGDDLVVDLGCGTGQLAIPIASHVDAVIGIDPEPDMLARACSAADEAGISSVAWMIGKDTDLPLLRSLLGEGRVAGLTIGQALHWMDHEALFAAARPLLRSGGGVVAISNGIPLWLQDTDWSRALRDWLQDWLGTGTGPVNSCGTDEAARQRYRESLASHGLEVSQIEITYTDELDFDHLLGGVYSSLPVDRLPPVLDRPRIADELRTVLDPHRPYLEQVPVRAIIGTKIT